MPRKLHSQIKFFFRALQVNRVENRPLKSTADMKKDASRKRDGILMLDRNEDNKVVTIVSNVIKLN